VGLSFLGLYIGVARILSARVHFILHQKSDDLFLVVTLFYMIIYVITASNYLFISLRGCTHRIQPHFCLNPHSNKKCLEFFFRYLHPLQSSPPPPTPMVLYGLFHNIVNWVTCRFFQYWCPIFLIWSQTWPWRPVTSSLLTTLVQCKSAVAYSEKRCDCLRQ